jgi:hypothetical protein
MQQVGRQMVPERWSSPALGRCTCTLGLMRGAGIECHGLRHAAWHICCFATCATCYVRCGISAQPMYNVPLQAVPWELSLAALRKFIWRQKDKEVVVEYRIADPANPAPLPAIEQQP